MNPFKLARIATGDALNRTIEIAGPEEFRLDELARKDLAARQDPRAVVTDPQARYVGIAVCERALLPESTAAWGETRFDDWLRHSVRQAAGAGR